MRSLELLESTRTEQELWVEVVRMCVAEAGYDPESIQPHEDPASGFTFYCVGDVIPPDVCWKARELSFVGKPKCYECTCLDRYARYNVRQCRSTERLELDCGAPMPK